MEYYSAREYRQPKLINEIRQQDLDQEICVVEVDDSRYVEMPGRAAILHFMLWQPLMHYDIMPRVEEVYRFRNFTKQTIAEAQTAVYKRLISHPNSCNEETITLLLHLFQNIATVYNFILRNLGAYVCSFSAVELTELMDEPLIKKLTDAKFDPRAGSKAAEEQLRHLKKELFRLLRGNELKHNVLRNYINTGMLNLMQLPQLLLAYGPRSDINDRIYPHVINESNYSGIRSVDDFITEMFSAKKALWINSTVIQRTQYSGRKMKLASSSLPYIYRGDCGSRLLMPMTIPEAHIMNYLDRRIIVNNQVKLITEKNHRDFIEVPVEFRSPMLCRHQDGICEECLSFGAYPFYRFIPPIANIGVYVASILANMITQRGLSTKHLNTTDTQMYFLSSEGLRFFYSMENNISWLPGTLESFKDHYICVPIKSLGPITDLTYENLPIEETYSAVAMLGIAKRVDDKFSIVESVDMEYETQTSSKEKIVPYFSSEALMRMKENFDQIKIVSEVGSGYVLIPAHIFINCDPFLRFIVINDDIIAFSKAVQSFFNQEIANYSNVVSCLSAIQHIMYRKLSWNSIFLEIMLRAYMMRVTNLTVTRPAVEALEHAPFVKTSVAASNWAISTLLAYEKQEAYLNRESSFTRKSQNGWYDPLYGWLRRDYRADRINQVICPL